MDIEGIMMDRGHIMMDRGQPNTINTEHYGVQVMIT